jgi:hypothetical protein
VAGPMMRNQRVKRVADRVATGGPLGGHWPKKLVTKNERKWLILNGAGARTRTADLLITKLPEFPVRVGVIDDPGHCRGSGCFTECHGASPVALSK